MTLPKRPAYETRRTQQLREELLARARVWLAQWHNSADGGEFGTALLSIAARIESEVTQRLDRIPEKVFRNFYAWLGQRGQAGLAAKVPVVFGMTKNATAVDAPEQVQLQAVVGTDPIVLETQAAVRVLPGHLAYVVAADPEQDAFNLPEFVTGTLDPPAALPSEWRLKSQASVGATQLQLEPEIGLAPGLTLADARNGLPYRIVKVNRDIVTIEPALGTAIDPSTTTATGDDLEAGSVFQRVDVFHAFGDNQRNRQEHCLYLGATDALNMESSGIIEIQSDSPQPTDVTWSYWGSTDAGEAAHWVDMEVQPAEPGSVRLNKPAGPVALYAVDNNQSRWLRAKRVGVVDSVRSGGFRLRINCIDPQESSDSGTSQQADGTVTLPSIEGSTNNTPLVLDGPFYPFGTLPRQFDAFYLGSKEVFSKGNARATLDFKLGYEFQTPLAAARLSTGYAITAVLANGKVARMYGSGSGTVSDMQFLSATAPSTGQGRRITFRSKCRPGATTMGDSSAWFSIGEDRSVFVLQDASNAPYQYTSSWIDYGKPADADTSVSIGDTVLVQSKLYAVFGTSLYFSYYQGSWQKVPSVEKFKRVIPILRIATSTDGVRYAETDLDELLCILESGDLVHVKYGSQVSHVTFTTGRVFLEDDYPVALRNEDGDTLCFAVPTAPNADPTQVSPNDPHLANPAIIAFRLKKNATSSEVEDSDVFDLQRYAIEDGPVSGHALSWHIPAVGDPAVVFLFQGQDTQGRAIWDPFGSNQVLKLDETPSVHLTLNDGPVALGESQLFPATGGRVALTRPGLAVTGLQAKLGDAILWNLPSATKPDVRSLVVGILDQSSAGPRLIRTKDPQVDEHGVKLICALDTQAPDTIEEHDVWVGNTSQTITGTLQPKGSSNNLFQLSWSDGTYSGPVGSQAKVYLFRGNDSVLLGLADITNVQSDASGWRADVTPIGFSITSGAAGVSIGVNFVEASNPNSLSRRPLLDIDGLRLPDGPTKDLIGKGVLSFASGTTPAQQLVDYVVDAPSRAILSAEWKVAPAPDSTSGNVQFTWQQPAALAPYKVFDPQQRVHNPELSWEYWNGTSWWHIPNVDDATDNFVASGNISFCVPDDLQPTEVLGRKNHWIRARLVGGDYGTETVSVSSGTVIRNTDLVSAPFVNELTVTYSLCCPVTPDYVIAQDSDSYSDQTNANRVTGAIVNYFVPLPEMLSPFEGTESSAASAGRALYLGFDTELTGGPITILFIVEEGEHDAAYPLRVEALLQRQFRPIVAEDGTRGLNETGIVSFTLSESPELTDLFGKSLYWIRLRPGPMFTDETLWKPKIRAAYLNAAWATAAETVQFELLGSSDGSPEQVVKLARTPVLAKSLELRVREPLGDEEIQVLRAKNPQSVIDELGHRPGPWVLWSEVVDPLDRGAQERVYALDSATGEIRFGNGINGKIPPVGTDAVLARRYRRGSGSAANALRAWSPISLITPLAGVESAVAPMDAAGGSDPEDIDTALRFAPATVRMRDRALSLRDFEILALQSSPEVGQVRALAYGAAIRLVLVMRGTEPIPSQAARRALKDHLLERAAPWIAATNALQIVPPVLVPVRVRVALSIDSINSSGAVRAEVAKRISALLDPATGGNDGLGWPLGQIPTDADVVARLLDIEHVETIDDVTLVNVQDESAPQPLTDNLRVTELLSLAADGVVVECVVAEGAA